MCTHTQNPAHPHSEEQSTVFISESTYYSYIRLCSLCSMYFTRCSHTTCQCQMLYVLFVECVEWEKIVSKNVSASAFTAPGVFFHLFFFALSRSPYQRLHVFVCLVCYYILFAQLFACVCACILRELVYDSMEIVKCVIRVTSSTMEGARAFLVHMHKFLCALNVWFSLFLLFIYLFICFLFFSMGPFENTTLPPSHYPPVPHSISKS